MYSNKKYMTPNLRTITFMKRLNQLLLSPPLLFCSYRDFHCPALSCAEIGGRRREDGTRFSLFLPLPPRPTLCARPKSSAAENWKLVLTEGEHFLGRPGKCAQRFGPRVAFEVRGEGQFLALLCARFCVSRDRFPEGVLTHRLDFRPSIRSPLRSSPNRSRKGAQAHFTESAAGNRAWAFLRTELWELFTSLLTLLILAYTRIVAITK